MKLTALATVAILALAGCGSAKGTTAAPTATSSACLPVGSAMGQAIMSAAESGARFVRASAVKSPDFAEAYFIAVEFAIPGGGNQVGVFASNALTAGGGTVMAVDGLAQEFTDWGDADTGKVAVSKADPSVDAAKACLK